MLVMRNLLSFRCCVFVSVSFIHLFLCMQNLQGMDERRTVKLGETYRSFAEAERRVIPIITKCLDGMVSAAKAVDEQRVRN